MRHPLFIALILSLVVQAAVSPAGDYWTNATEPGVATNNDCGVVSDVLGSPVIRRAFMAGDDRGLVAFAADRLNTGDEILVPENGRLEFVSGNNVVIVLGPGARVKFSGLRTFIMKSATPATRLDLHLLAGGARIQARLNRERPESVLIALDGAEMLLTRGDAEVSAEGGWYASALAGSAELRLRRAGVTGAPFTLPQGMGIGNTGEGRLDADETAAVKRRLPFSFETYSAALPPRPAVGSLLEAP